LFYLLGFLVAGAAGYDGLPWHYIFIASFLMTFGYTAGKRRGQVYSIFKADGIVGLFKFLVMQFIAYSALTAIVYFIAIGLSLLLS